MVGCALKRGMRAPELAVGDGALGFWSALRDVFPETRCQRDWVHRTMNVLDSMPKGIHGRAKAAIKEITHAQDRKEALKAVEEFAKEFGAKWPKAAEKITSEREALLTFYDYPAEHWRHLRTTNSILPNAIASCVHQRTYLCTTRDLFLDAEECYMGCASVRINAPPHRIENMNAFAPVFDLFVIVKDRVRVK